MLFRTILAFGLVALAGTAEAGLNFCNKTSVLHSFAIAHKEGDKWRSEGWWNIEPGACKTVIGTDLKLGYYYYRATAKGRVFEGDNFFFCTVSEVFDILGEQGNCAQRGYDKSEFRQIELEAGITEFTLNLVPKKEASSAIEPTPTEKPKQTPRETTAAPGTYGEPYSDNGHFQECVTETEAAFCAFFANGTKMFVYDDGRTPGWIIRLMKTFLPGQPIAVQGDMTGIYDMTADVVLRDVAGRPWDRADGMVNTLQGYWYSVDDPNSQFNILGLERENQYDGQIMGVDYLAVTPWCGGFEGGGPYLMARPEGDPEALCYEIVELSALEMVLMYLPRGNFLTYRKLD